MYISATAAGNQPHLIADTVYKFMKGFIILEKLDKDDLLRVYKNFTLDIDYIPSEESKLLLKEFFKEKRSRKNEQNRIKESESGTS